MPRWMVPEAGKNLRPAPGSGKIRPMADDEDAGPVHAIVVYRDEAVVAVYELRGEVIEIGRLSGCDIPLPDDCVADVHAVLERDVDGWHVVDLHSSEGTLLHAAGEGALAVGDVIEIGPFMLQLATPQDLTSARNRLRTIEQQARARQREKRAPACPACGSVADRTAMALRVPIEPLDVTLDSPRALTELRGELCPTCGHLSLFVRDPAAVVPS